MGVGTFVNQPAKGASVPLRRAKLANFDLPLLVIAIALAIFGLLMLSSASMAVYAVNFEFPTEFKYMPTYIILKQAIILIVSICIAFFIARMDYHLWRKYAIVVLALAAGLLIVAAVTGNTTAEGRHGLLANGSIQPPELAKLAIVIYLSVWLYSKREHLQNVQLGLIPMAIILGIVGGLILGQPDISAAATVFLLGGLLFFLAGGDLRQFVIFMAAALVAGILVAKFTASGRQRIDPYVAGLQNPVNSDYQVLLSLGGIVNGGWFGVGLGKAHMKTAGLPMAMTDSIFAVIVEELGLFGALITVGLYGLLLYRGLKIASKAPDSLGMLLAAGLTFWIVIEAFLNMGGITGLLPEAGNALPFISQGGSNLLVNVIAIAILLNISRQTNANGPVAEEWRFFGATVDQRRRNRRRRVPRARRS
jgi:cell division protein FtsW